MPKTFESEFHFPYPFQLSAKAVWNKYPNPFAQHVVSVDVIDQQLCPDTGKLRSERILGVRQSAPKWAIKLLGASEDTYVREVVMVDPISKAIEMTSTNLSLSEYLLVKEYITYKPHSGTPVLSHPSQADHPAYSGTTLFRQIAGIECRGLQGVLASAARKVEEWSFNRFGDNAAKGRSGLMSVLESMYGKASP